MLESLYKTNILENLVAPAPIAVPEAIINYNLKWSTKFNQGK